MTKTFDKDYELLRNAKNILYFAKAYKKYCLYKKKKWLRFFRPDYTWVIMMGKNYHECLETSMKLTELINKVKEANK